MNNIWKIKAPPRVVIFGWIAIWKRILTFDNLRRGRIAVNGCPMCLREESMDHHLMVNCKSAQYIWHLVVNWFGCCWIFPRTPPELFQVWRAPTGIPMGKELWSLTFLAILRTIRKERNSGCFEGFGNNDSSLVEKTKFLVAHWVSI